jgi:GNAT superfamily N-acetyltransferase
MVETTLRRIDELWAQRLGFDAARLRTPGVHAIGPDVRAARPTLFLLQREAVLLVCGEPDATRLVVVGLDADASLPDASVVYARLGERVDRLVGPAFIGYRDAPPALPPGAGALRALEAADRASLSRLRDAVSSEEWEHAGIASDHPDALVFGAFEGDRLLAAASFERLLGVAAHLGVVTHPASRGRGAGRRVVAAAAHAAAEEGLLLQYQTLEANGPSLRIARTLGFEPYARSLAVRLRSRS